MIEIAIAVVVSFVLGYVARKYVEKKWPAESALLDSRAKQYAEQAQDRAEQVRSRVVDKFDSK